MLKPQVFHPDSAISSMAQDALGRKHFARELAERLRVWNAKESLVVGLHGPWGSGKSSIKNMAVEVLREDSATCPHIIEFSPWQISGEEQLSRTFFREIGAALREIAGTNAAAKERAKAWARYGNLLDAGSALATTVGALMPYIGVPGAPLATSAGHALKKSADATRVAEKAVSLQEQSVTEVKANLREAFAKGLKKSVLIVIDDIDRLTFEEMRLLFRLVKANADFPRFIFLLLFEKSIAVNALSTEYGERGADYLEKIVQVSYDVPSLDRQSLREVLFKSLDRILDPLDLTKRFSVERWVNLFYSALQHYFQSLRDVYRFLNVFSFSISSLSDGTTLEVDPTDLIGIEVLRVFENDVYRQLPGLKDLLTGHESHSSGDEARKEIKAMLENVRQISRQPDRVEAIIANLFANLIWATGGMGYGADFAPRWRRDLRICHPDNFDRYFFLTVPEREVSEREFKHFAAEINNYEELTRSLHSWNKADKLDSAFSRIEAEEAFEKLPDPVPLLTALFDITDEMRPRSGSAGMIDLFAHWRTNAIAEQISDETRRFDLFQNVIKKANGVFAAVRLASTQLRPEKSAPDQSRKYWVSPEQALTLRALALEKIRAAAKDGRLARSSRKAYLLCRWKEWANIDEPRAWVTDLLSKPDGALSLLTGILGRGTRQSMGSYYVRPTFNFDLNSLAELTDLEQFAMEVDRIPPKGKSEDEKAVIKQFKLAMKRRRENKPQDDLSEPENDEG